MRTSKFAPGPDLAPFVEAFQVVETDVPATRTLVPDGTIKLGFRYGGHADLLEEPAITRLPDASLAGMRSAARRIRTSAGGGLILVAFRPGGAAAFFREPLHELYGAHVPLDALVSARAVEETAQRVASATCHAERVDIVSAFLRVRRNEQGHDVLVRAAVHAISAAPSALRVRELAARVGIGQDTLEKRFRRSVGATPKQLASILRLRLAVEAYRPAASLTRLALEAGYFDHPHFARELRAVTGEAPQRFFRTAEWC